MANTIITKQKDLPKLDFQNTGSCRICSDSRSSCNSTVISCNGSGIGTWYSTWRDISSHASSDHSGRTDGRTLYAGAVAGVFGPLVSFALSGMPGAAMLPFMMIELAVYGLTAGLLRNVSMPVLAKVVLVQIAGRLVRAAAIVAGVSLLGVQGIQMPVIWNSIVTGLPGLILQWTLLPLLVFWINNRAKNEQ